VSRLELAHTSDLEPATLAAARTLLYEVFGAELTPEDWEHSLGGIHALIWEREQLIAHAALVQRQLLYDGRALRTGYVEGVAVDGEHRRRGHGARLMTALSPLIGAGYQLGALGATEVAAPLYERLGWTRWQGPTWGLTPAGPTRTAEEDGWIYVLQPSPALDPTRPLTCDYRAGDLW
jgi:aminoglycoside 2'-N-acetyltransferase I